MAQTVNIKKVSLGDFFVGEGDIVMWDAIASYANATLASFLNGSSVGNVKEDSTNWTGEDISETVIRNEQGNSIATITTAGTLAFEMTLADFSLEAENDLAKLLLAGSDIDISDLTVAWLQSVATATAFGFGVNLPVITRPIAVFNQNLNKSLIFPKAQISSALVIEDKMICIHCAVSAQSVNTAALKSGMIVNGAIAYTSGS
jgi:hypothetical protein